VDVDVPERGIEMARKFSIGDTVEVVSGPVNSVKIGHKGKVIGYGPGIPYPYLVQRRNGNTGAFSTRELKLIRKGTKNGTN